MAIQQKQVEVKGEMYMLSSIPADKAFLMSPKIMKVGLGIGGGEQGMVQTLSLLEDPQYLQLAKDLVASASKGSMVINFNQEFTHELDKLYLLLLEIVKFNFESVFKMLGFGE